MPPPNVKAEDWAKLRPSIEELAHVNLGFIAMQRKNWDGAEGEFRRFMLNPNNAQVDYSMGTVIASEKKLDKLPVAMFYFARSATITGATALAPAAQKTALDYVQRQYKNFHGSDEGFNDLVALAKGNAAPPGGSPSRTPTRSSGSAASARTVQQGSSVRSAVGQSKDGAYRSDGANYFNMMKGSEVPTLKGKVIKLEPAD